VQIMIDAEKNRLNIKEGIDTEVMNLHMHRTLIIVGDRHGAEREIMRITRVPSGWLYETWANFSKTKRNATFVPYP